MSELFWRCILLVVLAAIVAVATGMCWAFGIGAYLNVGFCLCAVTADDTVMWKMLLVWPAAIASSRAARFTCKW